MNKIMTQLKGITKDSYISISLAIVLFSYTVRNEVRIANLEYHVEDTVLHDDRLRNIQAVLASHEDKFITKEETLIRLDAIYDILKRIEGK